MACKATSCPPFKFSRKLAKQLYGFQSKLCRNMYFDTKQSLDSKDLINMIGFILVQPHWLPLGSTASCTAPIASAQKVHKFQLSHASPLPITEILNHKIEKKPKTKKTQQNFKNYNCRKVRNAYIFIGFINLCSQSTSTFLFVKKQSSHYMQFWKKTVLKRKVVTSK